MPAATRPRRTSTPTTRATTRRAGSPAGSPGGRAAAASPATSPAFRCPRSCRASTPSRSACARPTRRRRCGSSGSTPGSTRRAKREAAQALVNQGADVLTNHSALARGRRRRRRRTSRAGRALCRLPERHARVSRRMRSSPRSIHHWGALLHARRAGACSTAAGRRSRSGAGCASGMVELGAIDPQLPAALRERIEARRRRSSQAAAAVRARRWSTTPARRGWRAARSTMPRSSAMDWLVDGVVGTLPRH